MGFFWNVFKPLAYLSLPIVFLGSISNATPEDYYYTRMFVYLGALFSVSASSIVTATAMVALGRPHDVNFYVARIFHALVWRFMHLRVELEGEEHLQNRPAIIMCNHQSMVDLLVIGKTMPRATAIMAKKELRYTIFGPFMMLSGAIFINRGNNEDAVHSMKTAIDLMKRLKISVWIFPEGTRHLSPEANILPFKKGGFHMAVQAGFPIIPVVTENYWHIYRKGFFGTGVIKVQVLPPVPTEGITTAGLNDLMDHVHTRMLETLRSISTHAQKPTITEEEQVPSPSEEPAFSSSNVASDPPTPTKSDAGSSQLANLPSSSASLASFATSSQLWKSAACSEAGGETEDDDMVVIGRPETK